MGNHPNGLRIHYHLILILLLSDHVNNFNNGGENLRKRLCTLVLTNFYKNCMRSGLTQLNRVRITLRQHRECINTWRMVPQLLKFR